MRSGRDLPGPGEPEHGAEAAAPATFPADAIKPTIVGIVTTIVAAWILGGALRLASVADPVFVAVYYVVIFAGLARTAVVASSRWGSGDLRADFGWWARRTDILRGCVIMWLAGVAGAVAVTPWGDQWSSNAEWVSSAGAASVVVFVGFALVAAPLFEELVFRGLLQRALTARFGAGPAIVLQGVVFALYHFNPTSGSDTLPNMVFLAAGGVVMGIAAHRYRRLGPTMCAHALANILATVALIGS